MVKDSAWLAAIERDERNAADAARLLRDDEAEECAKIAESLGPKLSRGNPYVGDSIAHAIRTRIAARAKETG